MNLVVAAALPAFLASLVEAVEAVTIILAVGVTRQWRSALYGAFAGLGVLAVVIIVFGTAIVLFVPLNGLRVVIGGLLLIYGLQWTTKAILRASGAKAKHDEDAIYAREVKRLREEAPVPASGIDGISFAISFKGVLLEGLEVAFIVITFGSSAGRLDAAAVGAIVAILIVVAVALVIHRPLSRVPENGLKFVVGVMLVTFGTFWAGEGVGIDWPLSDATLFVLVAGYVAAGLIAIWLVRRILESRRSGGSLAASLGGPAQ
ncbi:MAG: COG4280 domain-containing protein [Candidatus Limnocylindrales bacterium]